MPKNKARGTRALQLLAALKKIFPEPKDTMLRYATEWELLVAVILSAQCTDKKVNEVTERLFIKYPTIASYAKAVPSEFERDIFQTGFYKNKAKHIRGAAHTVLTAFNGVLPTTISDMLTIPGVGRKTANVVLSNLHGESGGIAVDTHVQRFAARFDLTDYPHDPVRIESDLMKLLPKKEWFTFTYLVIRYGREIAPARVYDVSKDPLVLIYPDAGNRFRLKDCLTKPTRTVR